MKALQIHIYLLLLFVSFSCQVTDPQREDVPELITKVKLTFIPQGSGNEITITATDPDAEGIQDIKIDGVLKLAPNTTYTLHVELFNELAKPSEPDYNLSEAVREEGAEHMFFFGWSNNVFSNPTGDGNIDKRGDAVNYTGGADSLDQNGEPLGLTTTWTTAIDTRAGNFRLVLKHQPGLKTSTSDSTVGETDLDLTFPVEIL